MKTKDNLLKGIIIGVCVVVIPLLLTGLTRHEPIDILGDKTTVGTYQISTTNHNSSVMETIINTKTGQVVKRGWYSRKFYPDVD